MVTRLSIFWNLQFPILRHSDPYIISVGVKNQSFFKQETIEVQFLWKHKNQSFFRQETIEIHFLGFPVFQIIMHCTIFQGKEKCFMEDMDCNNNPSWKESAYGHDDDETEVPCYRLLLSGFCLFTTWMAANAAIMGATNCIQLAKQEPVGSFGRACHIGLAVFMIPIGVIYAVICAAFVLVFLADCFSALDRFFFGDKAVKLSPSSFCPDNNEFDIEKGVQSEENTEKRRY